MTKSDKLTVQRIKEIHPDLNPKMFSIHCLTQVQMPKDAGMSAKNLKKCKLIIDKMYPKAKKEADAWNK